MLHTAVGELAGVRLEFKPEVAVSVVLASAGYPGTYETGLPITGVAQAEKVAGVRVFHAGTALREDADGRDELVTAGGRVLNVTALAGNFSEAIEAAYHAVGRIQFEGMFCRADIGQKALV
jgi:phosphoribosylamine--glycine ligase